MAPIRPIHDPSYIDAVILRDRDQNTTHGPLDGWWRDPADGALESRVYYCQNVGGWRADVSAVVTDTGKLVEGVKHTGYRVPIGLPAGDVYGTGAFDPAASAALTAAITGGYDVELDWTPVPLVACLPVREHTTPSQRSCTSATRLDGYPSDCGMLCGPWSLQCPMAVSIQ